MRFGIAFFVVFAFITDSATQAGPFRRYRPTRYASAPTNQALTSQAPTSQPLAQSQNASSTSSTKSGPPLKNATVTKGVDDALAEVNAKRAKQGLRPFLPDPLLNQAARTCAKIRATNFIEGHLASDFAYLPKGASAAAAGCGALDPSWGWGTCCTYENFTYAGAAWVMGADGNRYMHLFVR